MLQATDGYSDILKSVFMTSLISTDWPEEIHVGPPESHFGILTEFMEYNICLIKGTLFTVLYIIVIVILLFL